MSTDPIFYHVIFSRKQRSSEEEVSEKCHDRGGKSTHHAIQVLSHVVGPTSTMWAILQLNLPP
jgi:hypothetical protein